MSDNALISTPTSPCGLDLLDITGSDVKLEKFINSRTMGNDLLAVPNMGPKTVEVLAEAKIYNLNQLIGVFGTLDFSFEKCVDELRNLTAYNKVRQVVIVILYKLSQIGIDVPLVADGWRKY